MESSCVVETHPSRASSLLVRACRTAALVPDRATRALQDGGPAACSGEPQHQQPNLDSLKTRNETTGRTGASHLISRGTPELHWHWNLQIDGIQRLDHLKRLVFRALSFSHFHPHFPFSSLLFSSPLLSISPITTVRIALLRIRASATAACLSMFVGAGPAGEVRTRRGFIPDTVNLENVRVSYASCIVSATERQLGSRLRACDHSSLLLILSRVCAFS